MPLATRSAPVSPPPQSKSLIATTVVGMLLPIGFSLLPLAIAGLIGREPFPGVMEWASPDVLPFLALLGGLLGAATYWVRGSERRQKPSVLLRVGCGLAAFTLVPLPLLFNRASMDAFAVRFLALNFVMIGVAFAWRIAQWSGIGRTAAVSLIAAFDTYWIVGMLTYAPDRHAGLRQWALPVALVMFALSVVRGWRTAPSTD
jgi:hypothetical protein